MAAIPDGAARWAELDADYRQRRGGIGGIVGEVRPPDAIPRLVFMADAGNEGMASRLPDGEKDF